MKIDKIIVASDVHSRDGIGIEIYFKKELILEIFREDSLKTRTMTTYKKDIPLEIIQESIESFRSKIQWEFME